MTTLVDALTAIVIANWGGGGGGGVVPATIVAITDYRTLVPARDTVDNIFLELGDVRRRQVNDNYCDVTSTVLVTITTATSDDRLKELADECRWICNNVAVAGVTNQSVTSERDLTDRVRKVWVYQLTVQCIESLVSSSSAYAAAATNAIRVPANGYYAGNGAVTESSYGHFAVKMPSADDNCVFACEIYIPATWGSTTGNLKVYYLCITANESYSGKWYIGSHGDGDSVSVLGFNVLNASTAYDFAGHATAARLQVRTVPLTGLAANDTLGVRFDSDALNNTHLYIYNVWLEV